MPVIFVQFLFICPKNKFAANDCLASPKYFSFFFSIFQFFEDKKILPLPLTEAGNGRRPIFKKKNKINILFIFNFFGYDKRATTKIQQHRSTKVYLIDLAESMCPAERVCRGDLFFFSYLQIFVVIVVVVAISVFSLSLFNGRI